MDGSSTHTLRAPSPDFTPTTFRFIATGAILVVSAAASSFPSLVKKSPRIEPPDIVFFIGKHFGTGVILSTAFVHLLQEGFESLSSPRLSGRWRDLTGFLVLISFLSIFLVEYVSTAYVERISKRHGHHHHHHHHGHENNSLDHMTIETYHDVPVTDALIDVQPETLEQQLPPAAVVINERDAEEHRLPRFWRRQSHLAGIGHHRHESPTAHHHKVGPRLEQRQHIPVLYIPEEVSEQINGRPDGPASESAYEVSRKTRIIGILVLQLGIMIHSVVIGLTLSITEGANFTTLFTAVIFHQLFEGLSLGIRISTLPSGSRRTRFLPAILCALFAITAPLGLLLGMGVLPSAHNPSRDESSDEKTVLLTRGLMCALSAGMLIYAAAVEMLAGDFVMSSEMRQLSIRKQALGLASLVSGTVAMGVIGLWS